MVIEFKMVLFYKNITFDVTDRLELRSLKKIIYGSFTIVQSNNILKVDGICFVFHIHDSDTIQWLCCLLFCLYEENMLLLIIFWIHAISGSRAQINDCITIPM